MIPQVQPKIPCVQPKIPQVQPYFPIWNSVLNIDVVHGARLAPVNHQLFISSQQLHFGLSAYDIDISQQLDSRESLRHGFVRNAKAFQLPRKLKWQPSTFSYADDRLNDSKPFNASKVAGS